MEETGETLDTWEEEHTILCQLSTPDSHLLSLGQCGVGGIT